jgi:hypothetical protein
MKQLFIIWKMLNDNFLGKKLFSFCSHDINYRCTFTFTNWIAKLFIKCSSFSYDYVFYFLRLLVVCWYLRKTKPKVRKREWEKKPQIFKGTSMYKLGLVNNTNLSIVKSLWRTLCPNNTILIFENKTIVRCHHVGTNFPMFEYVLMLLLLQQTHVKW